MLTDSALESGGGGPPVRAAVDGHCSLWSYPGPSTSLCLDHVCLSSPRVCASGMTRADACLPLAFDACGLHQAISPWVCVLTLQQCHILSLRAGCCPGAAAASSAAQGGHPEGDRRARGQGRGQEA
eukprot:1023564-Rhodomonas_salina.3